MKKFFEEFKTFIARGNVMDMAVGIIIGGAFTSIVTSLVEDIINPLLGLFGGMNFDRLHVKLLGGNVNYTAKHRNGAKRMWTPEYLTIPEHAAKMIQADIAAEKDAIEQYQMHIKMIQDDCVDAVLARSIKDEEYHIMLLRNLLEEL